MVDFAFNALSVDSFVTQQSCTSEPSMDEDTILGSIFSPPKKDPSEGAGKREVERARQLSPRIEE